MALDLIAKINGVCKDVWVPRDADEAKLVNMYREDHNLVREHGVDWFIEQWKYRRNKWWVLEQVEWWEGVLRKEEVISEEELQETETVSLDDMSLEELIEVYKDTFWEDPSDYYANSKKRLINKLS